MVWCVGYGYAQEKKPTISYIAVAAKLVGHWPYPSKLNDKPTYTVMVKGKTNLPKDSILDIQVYDYIGQGSKLFSDTVNASVGSTGEFEATVFPKSGLVMRPNLQVHVFFVPKDQPAGIRRIYGKHVENLNGFQIGGNHGGRYLNAITVVEE
jgi:hypothetical protein